MSVCPINLVAIAVYTRKSRTAAIKQFTAVAGVSRIAATSVGLQLVNADATIVARQSDAVVDVPFTSEALVSGLAITSVAVVPFQGTFAVNTRLP